MIRAVVAVRTDSPAMPEAASVVARLVPLAGLSVAPEAVVGSGPAMNPKPARLVELFDLDNFSVLARGLDNPDIADP
jgi:hypothetical protein